MNEDQADQTAPPAEPGRSEAKDDTRGPLVDAAPDQSAAATVEAAGDPRRKRRRRRRSRRSAQEPGSDTAGDAAPPSESVDVGHDGPQAPVPASDSGTGSARGDAPRDAQDGDPRRKRRRKRRDPGEHQEPRAPRDLPVRYAPPLRGPGQLASIAVRALAEMAERLLEVEGVDSLGRPRFLEIKLRVPLDVERDGVKASRQAVDQIVSRVRDVREHEAALKPGAVYCFFSGSADERHSRPESPRQVFEGYGATGRPNFADFMTVAVERRAEGIDRLANGEDLVVTCVSMGRVLRTQQLHEFGAQSPVFRVLGQVDAGLYALTGRDEKAAFSFQLLRAQTLDGATRFRLHWVSGADLRDVADPMVPAILKRFQQRLDRESLRYQGLDATGKAGDDEEFVLPFLQELAKQLAGRARRAAQRTEHANERVDEGQRPTTKCWDDAREAGDDRILRDDEQGTFVVVGPKNRVHVFGADGKHVTSFVLAGAQVHRRVQEGRWHLAEPEDRGGFRLALRKRIGEGAATPVDDARG